MNETISIITPAYRAESTILRAVQSVLRQAHERWELLVVSDDWVDYEAVLGRGGVRDARIRFRSTGALGSGASPARSLGLDAAVGDLVAFLDADDLFLPGKLSRVDRALRHHSVVSCALQVTDAALRPLRIVGGGADQRLSAGRYKWVNTSMDSMVAYDRRVHDPRPDASFECLNDLELLVQLLSASGEVFHLGEPLHVYAKVPGSITHRPGVSRRIAQEKRRLLARLRGGTYPLEEGDIRGVVEFLERSLEAEEGYRVAAEAEPGLLFEEHLGRFLASRRRAQEQAV